MKESNYIFNTREKIKYLFQITVVRLLGRFYKKDDSIWIFGGKSGSEFSDNSRYFYEYILNNHKHIQPIWVTNEENVIKDVEEIGGEAYLIMSKKSLSLVLRAKVYVSSHFIDSDIRIFDDRDTIFVNVWHGMPIKKIVYDAQTIGGSISFFTKFHNFYRYKLLRYKDSRDLDHIICATSDYTKQFMESAFRSKNVFVTGQPRGDKIYNLLLESQEKASFKKHKNQKLIVYMPTHRDWGKKASKALFENQIYKEKFEKLLDKNDCLFLLKLHPNELLNDQLSETDRIKNISSLSIDVQELLLETDILITDYSSVFIDFAYLKKPVIFYPYDLDHYANNDMGLYIDYQTDVPGPVVTDEKQLYETLEKYTKDFENTDYLNMFGKKLNKYNTFYDNKNGKRIFDEIKKVI